MPRPTTKTVFWRGLRDGSPFILVMAPFAALFGVVASEAGLRVFEALTFSVLVLAGAAQFAALQVLREDAPTIIAIVTALAINLRMAMYTAALTPWLGAAPFWQRAVVTYFVVDQTYAYSVNAYEANTDWDMPRKLAYFFGVAAPIIPFWYGATLVGAWLGRSIPPELALDFAVPIAFIALVTPMLRSAAHVVAAFVGVTVSLALAWLPHSTGILVAGLLGMMTGAYVELRLKGTAR